MHMSINENRIGQRVSAAVSYVRLEVLFFVGKLEFESELILGHTCKER